MEERSCDRARRFVIAVGLVVVLSAGFSVLSPRAAGATTVCGHLTGTNTWAAAGNPYFITCDTILDPGASLTVQAGVTVLVDPGFGLAVRGYMVVNGYGGTTNSTVVFDSNASAPARGDWRGISVEQNGTLNLQFARVSHAVIGVSGQGSNPTGQGGRVYLYRSEVSDNSLWGLEITGSGGATGAGTLGTAYVHDNGGGVNATGLYLTGGSRVVRNDGTGVLSRQFLYLNGSEVSDNGGSGIVFGTGPPPLPNLGSKIEGTCIAANGKTDPSAFGMDLETPAGASVIAVFGNAVVDNVHQARDTGADGFRSNFWSDYNGTGPYVIDADSQDPTPLTRSPIPGCPPTSPDQPPAPARPLDAQLSGVRSRDVTLVWALSADDGAGEKDVTAYLVYGSTAFDPAGAGYALLATLPAGTATYADARAGVGDPQNHFYRLVVKDAGGQATASADQFVKYTRPLAAGSQLLSVPVRLSNTGVGAVLQTVDYQLARTYVNPAGQGKNWLSRDKAKPWGDLVTVEETMALWLLVNTPSDLVVAGLVPHVLTIHLAVGWNFVGYPSFVDRRLGDTLADARVQTVEGFDATNPPFYLQRLAGTATLHAGDGLWVHVSAPFDWTLTN